MDGELVAVEQSTANNSVSLIKDNDTLKKENIEAGLVVTQILHNNPNPVEINGKRHLEFEEWIALGNAYGITVKTGDAEPVEIFEAKGFKAKAEVIRISDGVIIGGAEAYCLNDEKNWNNKDYFQMASMAQTRAGSKALGNQLRGIVALDKTLGTTPAEEMNKPSGRPTPHKPKTNGKTSNLGHKPKKAAPKKPSKPKVDDEAIEVEATEVHDMSDGSSMSLKDIIDSDKNIRLAVDELQAQGTTVNRDNIKAKLLDLVEMGQVTSENYKKAKELLE